MWLANCIFMLWHDTDLTPRGQHPFGGMVPWSLLKHLNLTKD